MNGQVQLRFDHRRLLAELSALGAWWLHELREVWALVVARAAPSSAQRFILDLRSGQAILRKKERGEQDGALQFAFARGSGLALIPEVRPDAAPERARVLVLLPAAAVLTHCVRVPPIADRDVARTVQLQIEREAPLPAAEIYTAWRVAQKTPDGTRVIEMAMARRKHIDQLLEVLRAWGWRVLGMHHSGDEGVPPIDLLPAPSGRLTFAMGERERRLAWSATALCLCYGLLTAGYWIYERFALAERLDIARAQAAEIAQLKSELNQASEPIRELRKLMDVKTSAEALGALSAAVTTDSWVYHADIRTPAGEAAILTMEGYTPTATNLVGALAQSPHFEHVELIEATTADPGSTLSRVELSAGFRSGVEQ